jgi:hypothetical protein
MKKCKGQTILDSTLKQLVYKYCENPMNLIEQEENIEDNLNSKFTEMKKLTKEKNKDFDFYHSLQTTLLHPAYNVLIGLIDIAIFMLTLVNIEAFNNKEGSKEFKDGNGRLSLFIQVGLLSISMISQGVGLIGRGFRSTFSQFLTAFDLIMTLISFLLGMVLIS